MLSSGNSAPTGAFGGHKGLCARYKLLGRAMRVAPDACRTIVAEVLARIAKPTWVFTASTKEHATRCIERIGLAALELVATHGYGGTTMPMVAATAEVSTVGVNKLSPPGGADGVRRREQEHGSQPLGW